MDPDVRGPYTSRASQRVDPGIRTTSPSCAPERTDPGFRILAVPPSCDPARKDPAIRRCVASSCGPSGAPERMDAEIPVSVFEMCEEA